MNRSDDTWIIVKEAYLKLLPVQILGIVVSAINGFIDSLIVGKFLGTDALAAIGYFGPVTTIIGLSWVIITGIQVICSHAIGSGDKDRVVSLFSTGVVVLSVFSIVATAVCLTFHSGLATLLGGRGTTHEMLSQYIVGFAFGIIGQVLSGVLTVFLPFNNDTRRSYLGIATMITSNIIMDLISVFVLHLGCFGIGIATAVSYLLSSAVMFTGFVGENRTIHLRLSKLLFDVIPEAVYLGIPSLMFTLGCTAKGYIINIALMKNVGDAAVAVMNIQNNIIAIIGAIPMGCAAALLTLASLYYGDADRKSLVYVTKYALKIGVILSTISAVLLMLGSSFIPSLFFAKSDEAWGLAQRMLILFPNWLILNLIFTVFMKVYQCQGKMFLVNVFSFAENVVIAIISAVLTTFISADGVWISFSLCEAIFIIIIMISVFISARGVTFSLEKWMKLSDDFGARPGDYMEFSLHSMDAVINISKQVIEFCKAKGYDKKTTMMAGLSVEEVAGNIVTHGFNDGKQHSIDVRIVSSEKLIIRIRDNCREFDPEKYLAQFHCDDPAKNVGLKIFVGMAKRVSYQNNAGINTLLINV